jgi:hypothetical protein
MPDKKQVTTCEYVRTASSVVTALCMLTLVIALLVVGSWTVREVTTLQNTYHPEKLANVLTSVENAMDSVHSTGLLLKSERGENPLMHDLRMLIQALHDVAIALQQTPTDKILSESEQWRSQYIHLLESVKDTLKHL